MRDTVRRDQLTLFLEITDTVVTRDRPFIDPDGSWGMRIVPPPGRGWRVLNADRERFTAWMRRRPIVRVWKRSRTC